MPSPRLPLVPYPRKVELRPGCFAAAKAAWRISPDVLRNVAIAHKLSALKLRAKPDAALPPLTLATEEPQAQNSVPAKAEGYGLSISPRGVALRGADASGLFWGLVTLEQLLADSADLPALNIVDWPEISVRCHHDDISRKQISKLPDFKRIVRTLARFKINHYTLYIEDTLHLKSFPDIGNGRGKLMPGEVRQIVREGELNNVTVYPTFQLIGHQENLLALPKYAHLGREVFQSMSSLDPAKPAVREYLAKAIGDVCELFPAKFFCMGFDETQGVGKEQFLTHANWCAEQLVKHGKTPIMWVDMIYNHFGYDCIKELHPAIVPVNWNYGATALPIKHQVELEAQGRPVWGYAGYGNCGRFLPNFQRAKKNAATWTKQLAGRPNAGLVDSMWGDDGYENSRDLCWNLFAHFGECAWSGAADEGSFEQRFQRVFYGVELPELEELIASGAEKLTPDINHWRLHRSNACALFRLAAANRKQSKSIDRDEKTIMQMLAAVKRAQRKAKKERAHLDHFTVGLERMLSVTHRLQFAHRHVDLKPGAAMVRGARRILSEFSRVKAHYRRVWLRHNKPQNIEVSLAVFDRMAASYKAYASAKPSASKIAPQFMPLDLNKLFTTNFPGIGGIPIGETVCNGTPFRFAGINKTHAQLNKLGVPTRIAFLPAHLRDLHLVVVAPKPADERPAPGLRVELGRDGQQVFREDLLLITHLCDWWAPLGEHIWAGGGYRHVDPKRVRYLFSPNHYYGLVEVFAFALPDSTEADELVLTPLIKSDIALFAVTLELSR